MGNDYGMFYCVISVLKDILKHIVYCKTWLRIVVASLSLFICVYASTHTTSEHLETPWEPKLLFFD